MGKVNVEKIFGLDKADRKPLTRPVVKESLNLYNVPKSIHSLLDAFVDFDGKLNAKKTLSKIQEWRDCGDYIVLPDEYSHSNKNDMLDSNDEGYDEEDEYDGFQDEISEAEVEII